jgi:uroporphyrin-III C-methyltransferase
MTGRVVLVGAGPGDPDLITVKGARALAGADVVVYDRLAAPELVALAPPDAERIYVGKQPGGHAMQQDAINEVLVANARLGRTVVRLKGGDPFVFGRGGEELLACARAGITCEVIPGITSAIAAASAAGIPVTHRGIARSVAIVTASTAGTAHEPDAVDLSKVGASTDTLVLLMAAGRLAETCDALIGAGRPASEPAALVMWATTPEERTVIGTLRELPALAAAASMGPPATLVVGEVAAIPAAMRQAAHDAAAITPS